MLTKEQNERLTSVEGDAPMARLMRENYWLPYEHADPAFPKVFISELRVSELSASSFQIIDQLVSHLPAKFGERPDLPWSGRPWTVRRAEYESLLLESEYAAWVAAFGFRVNHFTVFVNALTTFPDLQSLNAFLLDHGFTLNESGGVIKGTPAQRLEQSSTRADSIEVELAGEKLRVPSCYYEFARRYPLPNGELFQGFVPASADKIFANEAFRDGYELTLTERISRAVDVPVIASGGVGEPQHLIDGLSAGADAVLAASIFHYGTHTIPEVKEALRSAGFPMRPISAKA